MGVTEQLIFPEIDYDKVDKIRGMDITFVTSAKTDDEAKALLACLRLPVQAIEGHGDSTPRLGGSSVAKKSMIAKAKRKPKYSTRRINRCQRCGRPRARATGKFGLCRICLREMASRGELPGVRKASW